MLQHTFYVVIHRTFSSGNSNVGHWLDCRWIFLPEFIKDSVYLILFRLMPIGFHKFPFSQCGRRLRACGRCASGHAWLVNIWRPMTIGWATCICYRHCCGLFVHCSSVKRTLHWWGLSFCWRLGFTDSFLKHVDTSKNSSVSVNT